MVPSSGFSAGFVPGRLASARGVRRGPAGRGGDRLVPGRSPCRRPGWTADGNGPATPPRRAVAVCARLREEVRHPTDPGRRGRGAPEVTLPPWRLQWVLIRASWAPTWP